MHNRTQCHFICTPPVCGCVGLQTVEQPACHDKDNSGIFIISLIRYAIYTCQCTIQRSLSFHVVGHVITTCTLILITLNHVSQSNPEVNFLISDYINMYNLIQSNHELIHCTSG